MILSFARKGLEALYATGSRKGINPAHAPKLAAMLHRLTGNRAGTWSIRVTGNYRLTFRFVGQDVELLDYEDCH